MASRPTLIAVWIDKDVMLSASNVTRMMGSGVTTKGGSGPTKPALAMRQLRSIQDDEAVVSCGGSGSNGEQGKVGRSNFGG